MADRCEFAGTGIRKPLRRVRQRFARFRDPRRRIKVVNTLRQQTADIDGVGETIILANSVSLDELNEEKKKAIDAMNKK